MSNDPLAAALTALEALVETIEATGGIVAMPVGGHAPIGDRDWADLAEAYLLACNALGRPPMVATEDLGALP